MSKAFVFGLIVGITLLLGVSATGFQSRQKNAEQIEAENDLAIYQAEIVDATPVQLSGLSVQSHPHNTLYNGLRQQESEKSISELIAPYRGKKMVLGISILTRRAQEFAESERPENYFSKLANASDAIIRGRATKKTSQITEDEKFLFTDYDVVVVEVIKNNVTSRFAPNTKITVTCPGGKILVDDVIVKADGNSIASLPVNNSDVVLFLSFIPEVRAYKLTRYNGGFELDGMSVRPLIGIFPPNFPKDEDSFLNTVKKVSTK